MKSDVAEFLDKRQEIGDFPTPLQHCENFSKKIGAQVYIKRDDLTDIAFGGNKVRKLEYISHKALEKDSDYLVTVGSLQSNHARLTAAVANKLDMDSYLILIADQDHQGEDSSLEGNLLLDTILGADVEFVLADQVSEKIEEIMENLSSQGHNPYFIPGGGHCIEGTLGYIQASRELKNQITEYELESKSPSYLVLPTGTGATHAGLIAGKGFFDLPFEIIGISIARDSDRCSNIVEESLQEVRAEIADFEEDTISVNDDYIEGGYGEISPAVTDAIKTVARLEGIILDPVYTGKAMAGLIDLIKKGEIPEGSSVVFLNTGGGPGLFTRRFEKKELWA